MEPTSKHTMIQVTLNDRLGTKVVVKCNQEDTIGNLKKLVAAMIGKKADKLKFQQWNIVLKDHITLADYEISDMSSIELYYI